MNEWERECGRVGEWEIVTDLLTEYIMLYDMVYYARLCYIEWRHKMGGYDIRGSFKF